jgi:co-chaperonin GroES (HSP10)
MKAGINYVLIRPDDDNDTMAGMKVYGEFDQHRSWSVFGEVVAVPERLFFMPMDGLNGYPASFLADNSLEWETEMELKVGDRVLYRYNIHMDDEGRYGGLLMIRYDMIYAKLDPFQPINGWVFLSGDRVVAMGKPNKRYLYYPERTAGITKVGDRVMYGNGRGVRVEVDEFNQLGPLLRMQEKEIMLIL